MTRRVRIAMAALLLAAGAAFAVDLLAGAAPVTVSPAAPPPPASPDAAAVRVPSSLEAWGGPRTGREPTLSDRVVHYDIAATLDPARHTVTGRERLTWRNRSRLAVKSVYLHLYMNAFESAGSTYFTERRERDGTLRSGVDIKDAWGHIALRRVAQGGAAVPWYFVQPDNGPPTDHTVVRLDLPAGVDIEIKL